MYRGAGKCAEGAHIPAVGWGVGGVSGRRCWRRRGVRRARAEGAAGQRLLSAHGLSVGRVCAPYAKGCLCTRS